MNSIPLWAACGLFVFSSAPSLIAQLNAVSGMDAALVTCDTLRQYGRSGSMNGLSMGVSICNFGSTNIDWKRPMDPRHPMYSFILTREANGRFEQISDWSYVKHGFLSINANRCGTCTERDSSILGPNCSDTYGSSLNSDRFYLGPPEEIDPWLGVWDTVGSHFDRGEPAVSGPTAMDGNRSLTRTQSNSLPPVTHRVEVSDADLSVSNANFFYGLYVVVRGEPGVNRENNFVNRRVRPAFNGSGWTFTDLSAPVSGRPILENWSGAEVRSAGNGGHDGVFYVGVQVTGPNAQGIYHYEYAFHNRDNSRAGAAFRFPKCVDARITNAWFGDIDSVTANDWTFSETATELSVLAGADNALEWNTIYNVAFDSDAAPMDGFVTIDQARPGPGSASVQVAAKVPAFLPNVHLGAGCGDSSVPSVVASGFGAIPNFGFSLDVSDMEPNGLGVLLLSIFPNSLPLGSGCNLWVSLPATETFVAAANGLGRVSLPLPIPNQPSFEGLNLFTQLVELSAGGPALGSFELSNGLQVRVGNRLTGCPR